MVTHEPIETDYLIVGAGAAAMAFADELLTHSSARIVMVDRRDKPGGHWNDAYPFVRLHQPSAFYGVNSRELGHRARDVVGLNKGLLDLASGPEILAYFDQVMQQRFLASGRVRYFPKSNVIGDDHFESLLTGDRHKYIAHKAIVDSAYWTFEIPSVDRPKYAVAADVRCIPPNDLPRQAKSSDDFIVVGPGKTGIDTCLWLLERGVDPARIRWIMPRDAWFINRAKIQSGDEFFFDTIGGLTEQFDCLAGAETVTSLFDRLESCGQLLRLDPNVRPTIYRCATVTEDELAELRRIAGVVRLGYVRAVDKSRMVLDHGEVTLTANSLIIDCSASGISKRPATPVWNGNRINIQMVRTCQPTFSAALIGFVETLLTDQAEKNALCAPVPNPLVDIDWLRMLAASMKNRIAWRQQPRIEEWLVRSRLNGIFSLVAQVKPEEAEKLDLLKRFQEVSAAGAAKLPFLLADASGGGHADGTRNG
jgi:hypothetical protein